MESSPNLKTTNVFARNLNAFYDGDTLIVNQGGQGSSKTYSIMQILKLLCEVFKLDVSVCSYALPHLKGGAMKDLDHILSEDGYSIDSIKNKSEHIYRLNDSELQFFGLESGEAKAHGPRRDILYVNEANNRIPYNTFELMNARTRLCTFIDFNPSNEFWFHEKIQPNFKHAFIKSSYLDNEYLPQREKDNILSKKDKPGFENWWKVYGLGELGQLEDAILTNWRYGDPAEVWNAFATLPFGYGLDFGSRDPDALAKVAVDKNNLKIYVKEEIYQNGLSTRSLGELIKIKTVPGKLIIADSAATRTIQDLAGQGLNIKEVEKGRIIDDIKMLFEYEIIVDPSSYNFGKELNGWIWLDKKGEIPLDILNHLIDAMRYYARTIIKPFFKRQEQKAL